MDTWMDEWIHGWMNEWMDEVGWTYEHNKDNGLN